MSIFDLTDFERQGQIETDIVFEDLDSARQLLSDATVDTARSIQIYTPDMEAPLYDHPAFLDNLVRMARGNRHASIQILAIDSSAAIKRGHGLLRLAHTLTSVIDIRVPAEEYQEDNLAFLLIDNTGFIYRPDASSYRGIYNPDCKVRARKLSDIFTLAWEHAEPSQETRRLNI